MAEERRPVRIVVAEDHGGKRATLVATLSGGDGFQVVGETATGRGAVVLCRDLRPDLAVIDAVMPRMDSLEVIREVKRDIPEVSILVLAARPDQNYVMKALGEGVSGYMIEGSPPDQVVTAIRKIMEGKIALNRELSNQILQRIAGEPREEGAPGSPPEPGASIYPLTPRETQILELLALGYTNSHIATSLVIGRGTVKSHVERIINKLGVSDRTGAVVRALDVGLIDSPRNL